jgi:predicted DNA-binding transcriptional regulator YafY
MPPVELTFEEALALTALANSVGGKGQIPYVEEASKAIETIRAQLPLKVKQELRELDTHLHIRLGSTSDGSSERNVYTQMRNAITDGRALVCEYEALHGAGQGGPFTFYPYALFYEQRAWYVVGKHSKRGELRTLKLGRFTSVKVSAETYRVPASFSLDKHLGLAWRMIRGAEKFEIELCIDPPVAEMLAETQWHRTQEVEHNDDGTLTFRYSVEGLDEIVYWILGLGPAVKVIKPDILAHRVRDLAQRVAARYA